MYMTEIYKKWNMTPEQVANEESKIRLTGYRLSQEEKSLLFWYKMELNKDINNPEVAKKIVDFDRKQKEETRKMEKKITDFENQLSKLTGDDETGIVSNLWGCYDYEAIYEEIEYSGAKSAAEWYYRTRY